MEKFIFIKVKTNSRHNSVGAEIEINGQKFLQVFVKASPIDGKANLAIIEILAQHFKCSKSEVEIVSGLSSKIKKVLIKL